MVADTLSRIPGDFKEFMPLCTEVISKDELAASISAVMPVTQGSSAWITTITNDQTVLETEAEYLRDCNIQQIEPMH